MSDVYTRITETILRQMKAGAGSWQCPWHRGGASIRRPVNLVTGNAYRGINRLMLWAAAAETDYSAPTWATYKQWSAAGCQVRRNEKSTPIIVYKSVERPDTGLDEEADRQITLARAYAVFNADQVDGYAPPAAQPTAPVEPLAAAETFIASVPAVIQYGGTKAFFSPARDYIQMPPREAFTGSATSTATEAFFGTLLHEMTHWTAPKERCDRNLTGRFGDHAYALEELVAELGAAFLCADLGVSNTPRPDHAAYLASWIKVLEDQPRALMTAAAQAEKAAAYLHGWQMPAAIAA